ncbi:hypothetical protein [Dehalobacterium formicoaceticum]|uniref:hypothetical protein n=1 Tax=Dehalobacterium formicoaceticum TaxID=51515 RepID=UPI000B7C6EBF|nr:hypothetical protein [Dehalobacterium formicoaceticum]
MNGMEELTNMIALDSFRLETIISLLLEKGIIGKEEYENKIFSFIERGEDEEAKARFKQIIKEQF